VEIGTTDMSELHSVKALLDCRATGSLINRDFVCSKGMNTQTLSHNIPVFNVNGFPNEAGQISKVVDIVLYYKTHSERMLLAISGLGKQNLILGYNWLKDRNPKIDWEKEEVKITYCPLRCEEGHALRKEQTCQKRIELQATTMTSQGLAEEARCSTHDTNASRKKPDTAWKHRPLPLYYLPTLQSFDPCLLRRTLTYYQSTANGITRSS